MKIKETKATKFRDHLEKIAAAMTNAPVEVKETFNSFRMTYASALMTQDKILKAMINKDAETQQVLAENLVNKESQLLREYVELDKWYSNGDPEMSFRVDYRNPAELKELMRFAGDFVRI